MTTHNELTRRHFLHSLTVAAATGMLSGVTGSARAATPYTGKLVISLQLSGGLDVTSFSDPKMNQAGKPVISNWATTGQIGTAGNLSYAPVASNANFFAKYYRDILVINGVDSQTNSHTVGVLHNWSGRNAEGYPSLTALFAGVMQSALPMPYLSFGGFGATQGVVTSTQIGKMSVLQNLVEPNFAEASNKAYVQSSDWQRIQAMHAAGIAARSEAASTLAGARKQQQAYYDALVRSDGIANFADLLPSTANLQPVRRPGNRTSTLHQQLQVSLLAFKAGVSVAADVLEGGFDTHEDHDARLAPTLANVTDAIDYCWSYAAELGLADRLVLVVGSDFGRTPVYNASNGKDHWPIGSVLVMQQNASFTNRVVGLTDGGHNALKINPMTLQADTAGITIKPAHVHKALRKHLQLDGAVATQLFPFGTTEDLAIFG
jgi:hypothetical protein